MMTWLKRFLPVFLLIFFAYVWYFTYYTKTQPVKVNVPTAQENLTLFVEPEDGKSPIISAIDNAQKEILVEVYILSDNDVINALKNAEDRGVAVDVILEQHPFGGGNLNPKTRAELVSRGVAVSWSNPSFTLTHEKSIVIDESKLFVLSQNLSGSSFSKNREYDILDTDKLDIEEVRNIFMADWKRNPFRPSDQTHLIVSPNTSRGGLTSLITDAKNEIDIEIEDINDNLITQLLSEKAKIIPVNIIIPPLSKITSNKKSIEKLLQNGANVKTLSSPYIHAKLILADKTKAYTGSVNLSTQSMDENRELGIIISDPNIVGKLSSTFNIDWENAISLTK